MPVEEWPLFRAAMTNHQPMARRRDRQHPDLAEEVRAAVRERGPLASRDFERPGRRRHVELEAGEGRCSSALEPRRDRHRRRVSGFQRLYDLAERVIPREVLDAPEPDEATRLRELALARFARAAC